MFASQLFTVIQKTFLLGTEKIVRLEFELNDSWNKKERGDDMRSQCSN